MILLLATCLSAILTLLAHAAGSYYMWRVPTQNLVKGKPGKKKAAAKPTAVPNTE